MPGPKRPQGGTGSADFRCLCRHRRRLSIMGDDPDGSCGLRSITLQDKPIFDSFLSSIPGRPSDYTFATNFMWRNPTHALWGLVREHLCVFANGQNGLTLMLPPLGDGDFASAVREAVAICRQYNRDHRCGGNAAVEYVTTALRDRFPPGFDLEPMSGDYIYSTERMISLEGGELAGKRHDRKRFMKRHQARPEPFGPQHVQPCLHLMERWQGQHADSADVVAQATALKRGKDVEATMEAIRNYQALGLTGMVLYAGQDLVGFTFGELLDAQSCSIIIEKTDRAYAGSAQYIFSEFCRQAWADTTWCNAGDDWEIPSLAYTKQSYHPAGRIEKWRLIPPLPVVVGAAYLPRPAQAEQPAAVAPETQLAAEEPVFCDTAVMADVDDLSSLERRSFPVDLAITRRQIKYLIKSPSATVRVIRRQGHVVASIVILRQKTPRGILARLYSLAVDSDFRGQGLGRKLAVDTLDLLRTEGAPAVILEVEAGNIPALRLYETLGFWKTRQLIDYYSPGVHGWKMRLDLVPADLPLLAALEVSDTVGRVNVRG